jgi:hypothetical protein
MQLVWNWQTEVGVKLEEMENNLEWQLEIAFDIQ